MPAQKMQAFMAQGMSPQQAYAAAYPGSSPSPYGNAQGLMPQMKFAPGSIQLPGGSLSQVPNPFLNGGGFGVPGQTKQPPNTQNPAVSAQINARLGRPGQAGSMPGRPPVMGRWRPMTPGDLITRSRGNFLDYLFGDRSAGSTPGRPAPRAAGALPANPNQRAAGSLPVSSPGQTPGLDPNWLQNYIQQLLARYANQGRPGTTLPGSTQTGPNGNVMHWY